VEFLNGIGLPSSGRSGGILGGVNLDSFDIMNFSTSKFF
jgi:hypothetical protein